MRRLLKISEKLIYAMSTNEKMKITQFNKYFRDTYQYESTDTDVPVNLRHQMIRILDSLGYCEFNYDSNMVYMCKPSFVLLPIYGVPKVILVGARIPAFIDKLKKTVKKQNGKAMLSYHYHPKININLPPAIYIEANNTDVIHNIAKEMRVECYTEIPAAWKLSSFSTSISDIKNSLKFEKKEEPNWKRQIFDHKLLSFSYSKDDIDNGISLAQYRNPINQQLYHLLWDGEKAAEVERDWGRYLVLSNKGSKVLLYDENTYQLAVPVTVPLPCILARAIALCTGLAPIMKKLIHLKNPSLPANHPIRIYSGVNHVIASLVASKLGQKLIKSSF